MIFNVPTVIKNGLITVLLHYKQLILKSENPCIRVYVYTKTQPFGILRSQLCLQNSKSPTTALTAFIGSLGICKRAYKSCSYFLRSCT